MDAKMKSIFLSHYCMIMADGIVSAQELETLYRIGQEKYQLSLEEINQYVLSAGTSFVVPESVEDRIRVLYQIAEIAWADELIDPTERKLLKRYVLRFGFLEDNADDITELLLSSVQEGISVEEILSTINNSQN